MAKFAFCATTSVAAIAASLLATPALAQTAPAAAARAEQGTVLEDIVVTARKQEESLQTIPVSDTAFSNQELTRKNINSVGQLQQQTPSFVSLPAAASNTTSYLVIRGQWGGNITLTNDATVAAYLDGVYLPRTIGNDASDLFDVNRVEILKGNQGTLYGRSATGGAINIFTNDPKLGVTEGKVRVRFGNYGEAGQAVALNLPFGETVAVRAVLNHDENSGDGHNPVTGSRWGYHDTLNARLAIRYEPTDRFKLIVRADRTSSDSANEANRLTELTPPNGATASTALREVAAERGLPATAAGYLAAYNLMLPYLGLGPGSKDGGSDISPHDEVYIDGISATADWQISDTLALKSISAYRHFSRVSRYDLDATPFGIGPLYDPYVEGDIQYSQEFNLSGSAMDSRLKWITGLYYSYERGTENAQQRPQRILAAAANPQIQDGTVKNQSFGVFVQATYAITDRLNVTAGIRENWDWRGLTGRNHSATTCFMTGLPLSAGPCVLKFKTLAYAEPSYLLSVDYQVSDDAMVYAKTARGYRAGGQPQLVTSSNPTTAANANVPFLPEFVNDYEIGLKSEWFAKRLRLNLAAYHSDYTDVQRNISGFAANGASFTRVENAARAKIDGFELESKAILTRNLEFDMNGSWTDARFTKYNFGSIKSIAFVYTPKWKAGASLAYTFNLPVGDLRTQLDYSYVGRMLDSLPNGYSPGASIWNGRVNLHIEQYDMDVAIWGRNLLNHRYWLQNTGSIRPLGFVSGFPNPPRTFGVDITKNF